MTRIAVGAASDFGPSTGIAENPGKIGCGNAFIQYKLGWWKR